MFHGCNNNLDFSLIATTLQNETDLKRAVGNKVLVFTDNDNNRAITATIMYGEFTDCDGDLVGKEDTYALRYDSYWELDLDEIPCNRTWREVTPDLVMYVIY